MSDQSLQTCPVCGVKIMPCIGGDKVMFAVGPPGTRSALWTRVCQYANKDGCINQDDTGGSTFKSP